MMRSLILVCSLLTLGACATCPPDQKVAGPEHCYRCAPGNANSKDPRAPSQGSVVLSRDSLYPVRVRYINLPYIDAGAVMQTPSYEHVLTRQFPSDNNYDHTWNGQVRDMPQQLPGRPYILPSSRAETQRQPPVENFDSQLAGLPPPPPAAPRAAMPPPPAPVQEAPVDNTPKQKRICLPTEHEDTDDCREMGS